MEKIYILDALGFIIARQSSIFMIFLNSSSVFSFEFVISFSIFEAYLEQCRIFIYVFLDLIYHYKFNTVIISHYLFLCDIGVAVERVAFSLHGIRNG